MMIEEYLEQFTATERETFQRVCRRLLKQTFIVRDKNEESRKNYLFVSKNYDPVSLYFRLIGFDIILDRGNGVVMLRNYAEESGIGRIQSNRLQLKKDESIVLCCLWTLYVDRLKEGNLTRPILITVADLRFALEKYGIKDEIDKTRLRDMLKIFIRYQLVDVKGEVGDPDCLIRLYPSLEFALDTEEFRHLVQTASGRMLGKKDEETDFETEESEDDAVY